VQTPNKPALIGALLASLALGACGSPASSNIPVPTAVPAGATAAPTAPTIPPRQPAATAAPAWAESIELGEESQAVVTGALEYARGQLNLTADDLLRVEVQGIEGDFARVVVIPALSLEMESATVFLKRDGGTWQGLTYGTAFAPEDLRELGVPEHLQVIDAGDMFDPAHDTVPAGDYLLGVTTDEALQAAGLAAREATGLPADAALSGEIVGIDGAFARVFVTPDSPEVDSTTVFLKRVDAKWEQVLTGSAFTPEDLSQLGIPETLWR
jgi:hypothetical protein